jgi:hypothetical protein
MPRRDFITPPNLPTETIGRCISIPASQEWLGLINSALLFLTQEWRYEQIDAGSLTPEEAAAAAYSIYVSYLTSNCTGGAMSCNDVLACLAAAGTGSAGADYDYLRANPTSGDPQWSTNGTDWFDLQQVDPEPVADACLAATRAALVTGQFWQQTFVAAGESFWSAIAGINRFLAQINQTLLGIIYGEYAEIVNAIIWGDFDFATYMTTADLTAQQYEDLTCLLYDNATLNEDGTVSFDFGAVHDNLISVLGVNPGTALTLLVAYMGETGLNQAGQVSITDTGDCNACEPQPFSAVNYGAGQAVGIWVQSTQRVWDDFVKVNGTYSGATGYLTGARQGIINNRYFNGLSVEATFPDTRLTRVQVTGYVTAYVEGTADTFQTLLYRDGAIVGSAVLQALTGQRTYTWSGDVIADKIVIIIRGKRIGADSIDQLKRIEIDGIGENPF